MFLLRGRAQTTATIMGAQDPTPPPNPTTNGGLSLLWLSTAPRRGVLSFSLSLSLSICLSLRVVSKERAASLFLNSSALGLPSCFPLLTIATAIPTQCRCRVSLCRRGSGSESEHHGGV